MSKLGETLKSVAAEPSARLGYSRRPIVSTEAEHSSVKLPPLNHIGIVVADLEAASRDFSRRYALDQHRLVDLQVDDALVGGERISFSARYAFHSLGNTDIELIQPLDGRSPYTEFLAEHGEGIHHLAFVVASIDAHLEQLRAERSDCTVLIDATTADGAVRFVYVDGTAHGAVLELIERSS